MLQGVHQELVQHESNGRGLRRGHVHRLQIEIDGDIVSAGHLKEFACDVADEFGEIELPHVLRLVEPPMDGTDRLHALQHAAESDADGGVGDRGGLHGEQRGDHLDVVLDAMIDLVDQHGLRAASASRSSSVRRETSRSSHSRCVVINCCAETRSVTSSWDAKKNCNSPAALVTGDM